MKVLASAPGTAGHLRPFLPLLAAAVDAGHDVVVALPEGDAADAGRRHGLHVREVPPPSGVLAAEMADVGRRTVEMMRDDREAADRHYVRESFGRTRTSHLLPALRELAREHRPDLVVHDPFCGASAVLALEHDLPTWQTMWSRRDPLATVLPDLLDGIARCPAAAAIDVDELRVRLADGPRFSPLPASFDGEEAADVVVQRWRSAEPAPAEDLDEPLAAALARDGRDLVYATLGTVVGQIPPLAGRFASALLGAMAELDVQCVFTVGRETDLRMLGPTPANVRVEPFVPHGPLLARAVACVSHGGVNTLLDAMAAAVPQVVLPMHSADGHWNAARLEELGAGSALAGPTLTPEHLVTAVTRVRTAADLCSRVDRLAADVAALPSPRQAITAIG